MKKIGQPSLTRTDVDILEVNPQFRGFYGVDKYRLRHRRFAGDWSAPFERELILRYRVAAALPYDPILDKVVLIEQFRIGALADECSPWLLEMVAGIMTQPESLESLIEHEMQEEAGLSIQALLPICDYWVSPGGSSEKVALFCAKVDASKAGGIHGLRDENEDIQVHVFDSEAAFAAVRKGRINNAATIIALQWLELNLTRVKQTWPKLNTL